MKFNYEKFPVLGFLKRPRTYPLYPAVELHEHLNMDITNHEINDLQVWLDGDVPVRYITKPFIRSFFIASERIEASIPDYVLPDQKGVFLFGVHFYMYWVYQGRLLLYLGAGNAVAGVVMTDFQKLQGFISPQYKGLANEDEEKRTFYAQFIRCFLYFIDHCDIETKMLPPKTETTIKLDRYVNQTPSNVQILNCTWFTNLIQSIGHHVSGHFRWQPYGPGRSLQKLIWITDFERGGFMKQARVLKQIK